MSWERKQPKRETTLVRLTRQAKAIEKLRASHDKAVGREIAKLHAAINLAYSAAGEACKRQDELEVLQSDFEGLLLQPSEDD